MVSYSGFHYAITEPESGYVVRHTDDETQAMKAYQAGFGLKRRWFHIELADEWEDLYPDFLYELAAPDPKRVAPQEIPDARSTT